MFLEFIRQNQRSQARMPSIQQSIVEHELLDLRSETTDRTFLDRQQQLVPSGKVADQVAVDRLRETGIRDGD